MPELAVLPRHPALDPRVDHELKCWPDPFRAVWEGRKRFEWRTDDRPFNEGDVLGLSEWVPEWVQGGISANPGGNFTGRWLHVPVPYVMPAGASGLPRGRTVLSLGEILRDSGGRVPPLPYPARVISGGQTGADTGGLVSARAAGIPTGGTAPQGWLREDDRGEEATAPWLAEWGLVQCTRAGYRARNLENIGVADMTAIFHRGPVSGGTLMTLADVADGPLWSCDLGRLGEPGMATEYAIRLAHVLSGDRVGVLNVAGPRESKAPGIEAEVAALLARTFRVLRAAQGE